MSALFSCREAARLLSESLDHPLVMRQRVELQVHMVLCGACRVHRRQIRTLELLVRRYAERDPLTGPGLDVSQRERIRAALAKVTEQG